MTLGLLLLAGCGGATPELANTGSPTTTESPATAAATPTGSPAPVQSGTGGSGGVTITVDDSEFGPMLFDGRGQAVYLFAKERTSEAQCYGACAKAWPPVLTDGPAQPRAGARQALLGTTTRTDGSTQVTYAGHPLYYYAHEGPGQVLCHDVREFGGLWLVVTPRGTPAD